MPSFVMSSFVPPTLWSPSVLTGWCLKILIKLGAAALWKSRRNQPVKTGSFFIFLYHSRADCQCFYKLSMKTARARILSLWNSRLSFAAPFSFLSAFAPPSLPSRDLISCSFSASPIQFSTAPSSPFPASQALGFSFGSLPFVPQNSSLEPKNALLFPPYLVSYPYGRFSVNTSE